MSRGKDEKRVLDQARLNRVPPPDWLLNAPQLRMGLELYYYGFWELDTCRQISMAGVGPIPWTAINDYIKANGFDEDTADRFHVLIRMLDGQYMKHQAAKAG